ncbi:TLD-domain-containing protein [Lasiosphaeria ovina]|uniref:Restriction of telomere capping protein 5 n=1 Tax=Lasiosphaeria ovina TaxID=92902 RepID=A0AAE0JUF3_9PEZI|nr:TLD-domain-containing protein [Lasiosphaeria ovina]
MGQTQSDEGRAPPSHEKLTKELANTFAEKCFTSLELISFKDVFRSLADHEQNVRYLKEDTIARFLEVPDGLGASAVIFQMMSYVGAFPFLQDAPAMLGLEQMVMVITIMTERYRIVLGKGAADRRKLLFRSLAVYDRNISEVPSDMGVVEEDHGFGKREMGVAIDEVIDGDEDKMDECEVDGLVLAAFDSLDYTGALEHEAGTTPVLLDAVIPADNFRRLLLLLLFVAPLGAQDSLSAYSDDVSGAELGNLKRVADCVLRAFIDVERSPGIKFRRFHTIIPALMPSIFDGLTPLVEHFLFSKNLDFHSHKDGPVAPPKTSQPVLQDTGTIMNSAVLSQLSLFLPGSSLFRRTRLLYSGGDDGFSMGSFESKVFNWRAPTLLLVSGTRLPDEPGYKSTGAEYSFLTTLPSKRFSRGSTDKEGRLTFGLYVSQPWKHTHRECFGGEDTYLFQLEPFHDVFRSSASNKDYVSFTKPSAATSHAGISVGCPPPQGSQAYRRSNVVTLGAVSLVLDGSFEFGCFTNNYTSGGGAFHTSVARKFDFQDRFEVTNLEVWGCGGDEEAKHQIEHWEWEAREAEARRKINLGTGDIEADRALLEMAGLIGTNRSGGSMG